MMLHIKRLLDKKLFLTLAIIYSCAITVLFLMPSSDLPRVKLPSGSDKIVHLLIHFLLVLVWQFYLFFRNSSRLAWKQAIIILAGSLFYGILIELLQGYFTDSRTPDILDVLANFSGALIGIFLFQKVKYFFTP